MQISLDEFVERMRAAGCEPVEGLGGQWGGYCPGHDDANPSLSFRAGESQSTVVHCHAGCGHSKISEGLGIGGSMPAKKERSAPRARAKGPRGRIIAQYNYVDRTGAPCYQVVRFDPKRFMARTWNGLSWTWNLNGTGRLLYNLPAVFDADLDATIYLVEGEKDADRLIGKGLIATTNAFGCDGWDANKFPDYVRPLAGRNVVIVPDNDKAGIALARRRALDLAPVAESVKVLSLPELAEGGDVSDWLDAGHTVEELVALTDEVAIGEMPADPKEKEGKEADVLVKLAKASGAEFFYTSAQKTYATFPVGNHRETAATSSKAFHRWLQYLYFTDRDRAANPDAVRSAAGTLEALALFQGQEREVYVRIAGHDGAIYLDLGDPEWRVVEISTGGWRITTDAPIRFRRPQGMLALPEPRRGGSIHQLRRILNVTREDWPLVAGFVVMCFRPRGPYPILVLIGGQGTAKTTNAKAIRALVDPNTASTRAEPKMLQDVIIAANNAWVVAFDNVSKLPGWLSDTLCQLATGGAFGTRMLYSDDDEVLFSAQRPIVLNGITEYAARGDLLDRSVLATPPVIDEEKRKEDEAFWTEFEAVRPQLLGAVLDAVVTALRRYPDVKLNRLPRMADFARWVSSAEPALGLNEGEFLEAYATNREDASTTALEGSPVAQALILWAGEGATVEPWEGTASELLEELAKKVDHVKADDDTPWPRTGKGLASVLRRLEPNLRRIGIDLNFRRDNRSRARTRLITVSCHPDPPKEPSESSNGPKTTSDQDFCSDASRNGHRPNGDSMVRTSDGSLDLRTQPSNQPSEQNRRSEPMPDGSDRSDDLSASLGRGAQHESSI